MITSILEYLESSASRYPDKTAFADLDATCTFEELRLRARRVGTALAEHFAPRNPVPVFMEKSVDTIGMFMGAVYAGCFYVLLDTKQPAARISQILDILDSNVIVTSSKYQKDLEKLEFKGTILLTEELEKTPEDSFVLKSIRDQALDTDPLYGIFTSGSTGVPKGVVVGHRSVIDFIDCFTELFHITGEDVMGNQAPWDFDVSVKDIYSAITTGATLVLVPKRLFSLPPRLLDYLCDKKVTVMVWAVSALCLISSLKGLKYKIPEDARIIMFSGEVMPVKQMRLWQQALPQTKFINLYGPSEITCNCTWYPVEREFQDGEVIPAGRAFDGRTVFLLDETGADITESGKTGEICVAGESLADGYYHNEEETARRFVTGAVPGETGNTRFYRTGDLGYFGEDENLYFAGRKDFQIKHMGHRIELEEIERAFEKLDGVSRCCCLFDTKRNKLLGFYTGDMDEKEVHQELKRFLPIYMIPAKIRRIEEMPLNKNGKIDRKYLAQEWS